MRCWPGLFCVLWGSAAVSPQRQLSSLLSLRSAEEPQPAAGATAMERPGHGGRGDRERQAAGPAPGAVGVRGGAVPVPIAAAGLALLCPGEIVYLPACTHPCCGQGQPRSHCCFKFWFLLPGFLSAAF